MAKAYAQNGIDGLSDAGMERAFGNNATLALNKIKAIYDREKYEVKKASEQTGRYSGDGLVAGMQANEGRVYRASSELAGQIAKGETDVLQIHSPSRVTQQIGQNAVEGLINGMNSYGNWSYQTAVTIGYNIAIGLGNGIYSGQSYAISAAATMAANTLSAAKRKLGIASPSKVFAAEVGKWIPAGIGEGIENAMPGLLHTTRSELDQLTEEMNSAVRSEMGGFTIEKMGRIEYDQALVDRLSHTNVSVTGKVEDDRPVEIHTHLHLDKKELAEEITPEVNHQLYKIDSQQNNRGRG